MVKRVVGVIFAAFMVFSLTASPALAYRDGGHYRHHGHHHHGYEYWPLAAFAAFALLYPLCIDSYYWTRRSVVVEAPPVYAPWLSLRDRDLAAANFQYTLEKVPSGQVMQWHNPRTGHSGTLVAQPAYKNAVGQFCRGYQQTLTLETRVHRSFGAACRSADGVWRIDPYAS
jgi:hypothetical protein